VRYKIFPDPLMQCKGDTTVGLDWSRKYTREIRQVVT